MGFQPEVSARIMINGKSYQFGEHPHAQGVPYGQEGRQGTVYLLYGENDREKKALKVFRNKFVDPSMVFLTQQLTKHKAMAGLMACERFVVTPQNNAELLAKDPELLYAVVMSWVEGPTWMDVLLNKQRLTRKQSFSAAFALTQALMDMEQRGLAHCDLSAPNVIMSMLDDKLWDVKPVDYVQLIDLEQMFSSQLERPEHIPAGSPGYAKQTATQSLMWGAHADRFAGAMLIVEMLGACTDTFMDNAWGESYFAPTEMQSRCNRFDLLMYGIRTNWGDALASLFARAWGSEVLTQCPTFAEWAMELSKMESTIRSETAGAAAIVTVQERVAIKQSPVGSSNGEALQQAKRLEANGNHQEAIEVYRSIYVDNPHPSMVKEIEIAISNLEGKLHKAKPHKLTSGASRGGNKLWISSVFFLLMVIGFLTYKVYGNADNASAKSELASANLTIGSMSQAIAEGEQQIVELTSRLKEQSKPPTQKRIDWINLLNKDYEEITRIAQSTEATKSELDKKTFEASEAYINHLFDFVKVSYQLDQQWADRTNIVQGYYFPYMYNRNRNAQLNLQFFESYKDNFR
ncbi:hypothetical protein [Cohnella lupini]|uniref:Protein kinase domain-containing protein n=1 Tax=Cohnella lupini TaxID=1294267 RepID=A0A3D9HTR5_9BACL|nr:hypothetical protein [Cohnella lupini]RED52815.1 hypothetical protein DFP95_13019 [Cohnella lupini]